MSGLNFGAIQAATAQPAATLSPATKTNSAADNFLDYMKESPAERMADSWLASHGLSKEKLAAMTPAQRDAVLNQMAKELRTRSRRRPSRRRRRSRLRSEAHQERPGFTAARCCRTTRHSCQISQIITRSNTVRAIRPRLWVWL
jgi:hypothetical protein